MTIAKAITKTLDISVEDVRIDLTATIRSYDLTDTQFIFEIKSSNGMTANLTGSTAIYIVEYVHNSQTYAIQGDIDIIGTDTLSFNLPEDLKGYSGTVLIGIYVKLTDGTKIDIKDIAVRIEPSIMDKDIDFSAKTYFKDFETVKAEVILEGEKAKTNINAVVSDVNGYADSQKQAINNIVSDVQSTGDTAKEDIKATLPSLQTQVSELKSDLVEIETDLEYAPKKNLIDFSKCIMNKELKSNLGVIGDANGWYVTDWLEVEPNTEYAISGISSSYKAEVDESKTIHTSVSSVINNRFTTGSNTKFVRFNSKIDGYSTPQLEKGTVVTPYEPYTLTATRVKKLEDVTDEISKNIASNNPIIILPNKIYCAVGSEINLYYENIVLCDNVANYDIDWSMNSATSFSRVYNECLRLNPTDATAELGCILKVKDKYTEEVIVEKSFKVQAYNKNLTKNVVFIGDSLTDRGYYEAEIQENLSNNGITTVGTLVDNVKIGDKTITTHNEGRSGWSAYNYLNSENYNGFNNAFYNPSSKTFDFSYYVNHNGFSNIDCVVITLGTNDIAGLDNINGDFAGVVNNIKAMVNSVHAYNSNIKVIVSLTTPGAEQDGWGKSGGRTVSACAFNFRQKKLVSMMIDEFDNKHTNVYISPNYINIDTHRDFPTVIEKASNRNSEMIHRQNDNVHPSTEGYLKIADVLWGTLLSVFD